MAWALCPCTVMTMRSQSPCITTKWAQSLHGDPGPEPLRDNDNAATPLCDNNMATQPLCGDNDVATQTPHNDEDVATVPARWRGCGQNMATNTWCDNYLVPEPLCDDDDAGAQPTLSLLHKIFTGPLHGRRNHRTCTQRQKHGHIAPMQGQCAHRSRQCGCSIPTQRQHEPRTP